MKCVVPNCRSRYGKNSEKVTLFKVKAEYLTEWDTIISRKDKRLTIKDHVCEKHFKDEDIIRIVKNELNVYQYQIKYPRLVKGAKPTEFLNCPRKKSVYKRKRQIIQEKNPSPLEPETKVIKTEFKIDIYTPDLAEMLDKPSTSSQDCLSIIKKEYLEEISYKLLFLKIYNGAVKVTLPSNKWIFSKIENSDAERISIFKHVEINQLQIIKKQITMSLDSFKCYIFNHSFDHNVLLKMKTSEIAYVETLELLLLKFDVLPVCYGGISLSDCPEKFASQKYYRDRASMSIRHVDCKYFYNLTKRCTFCQKSFVTVKVFRSRCKASENLPEKVINRTSYNTLYKRDKRMKEKVAQLTAELTNVRLQMKNIQEEDLLAKIESMDNIPSKQKMLIFECLRVSKYVKINAIKYSSEWLLLCLVMHIKSPSTYKFLQSNKIMPLPTISTVRKYLSVIHPNCALDQSFFQSLEEKMKGKNEFQRQGILLFDEMQVRKIIKKSTGIGDGSSETPCQKVSNKKTDHTLVFMWSSLTDNFTQPFAVYVTKEATEGTVLAKLILKAINKLETTGARVHGIVCEGANTNKKLWPAFGICGKINNPVNKITHPIDEDRLLFFLSDTPHLIKCVRNEVLKSGLVKTPGGSVYWSNYKMLFDLDSQVSNMLRVCPKITKLHVEPTKLQKKRVELATQIFSNSVAKGLKYYSQDKNSQFQDVESTIEFTERINDLFDALNRRQPSEGIKKNSKDFEIMNDNLEYLNKWEKLLQNGEIKEEQFLSTSTVEGLRITLLSSIELCNYLFDKYNFEYVLTSKINQDPLKLVMLKE